MMPSRNRFVALLVSALLATGCAENARLAADAAAAEDGSMPPANVDASLGGFEDVVIVVPPAPLPPPDASCGDSGVDASACPLPPSFCLDSTWLEYFDDGRCSDAGRCEFVARTHDCGDQSPGWCIDGGCVSPGRTAVP